MLKKYKILAGFSLLETVVAIAALTIALLGVYDLMNFSVSRASLAKNQNIAFFLAQEAQEYISNHRLNNTIQEQNWISGLSSCRSSNGCYIDAVNKTIQECSENCPVIKFDPEVGYNYQSGQDTIFQRIIKISVIDEHREIKVEVQIIWRDRAQTRSFILENHLFNWS